MFTFREGKLSYYIPDEKQSLQLRLTLTLSITQAFLGNNEQSIQAHNLKVSPATFQYNGNSKCQLPFSLSSDPENLQRRAPFRTKFLKAQLSM